MKTRFFIEFAIVGCMVLSTTITLAQQEGFHFGSRFGIGESTLKVDQTSGEKSKLALSLGATSTYQFNRYLGLSADFAVTSIGGRYNGMEQETDFVGMTADYPYQDKFNVFQGELPITMKLSIPLGSDLAFRIFVGPSMHFHFIGLQSREYSDENRQAEKGYYDQRMKNLETINYGMVYGLGLEVDAFDDRLFFLDFRTNQPLTEIGKIYEKRALSNYYMVSIGYLF